MGTLLRNRALSHLAAVLVIVAAATPALVFPAHIRVGIIPLLLIAVILCAGFGGLGPGLTSAASAVFALMLWLTIEVAELPPLLAALCFLSFPAMAVTIGILHNARCRAENALRERDARLKLISQQIPGGVWSTDTELRLTSGFGSDSELLSAPLGTSLFSLFNTDDSSCPPIAAHRWALRGQSCHYELTWQGRTFQCHVEPLRDGSGRVIGTIGVGIEITDRKRAEQALHEARQQLEAANRAKDHFLATLSHELRTPLTPALALVSCLEEHPGLPTDVHDELGVVRRNIELESRLIEDLLDVTRIASGKLQIKTRAVDLHTVLRETLDVCRHATRFPRLRVEVELQASRSTVRGDPARLEQVFWNLIKNAIKFTPDGGSVRIRTRDEAPGHIRIDVVDDGIGIAPEVLPGVFNPFEQGSSDVTRQFGGLGLGLAICKAIIDAHGGRIAASSEGPGKGATFSVELAAIEETAAAEAMCAGEADHPAPSSSNDDGGVHILLVDDHEDTLRVMARILTASGHQVTTANSVASAMECLRAERPDLIISDIGLPDGSGRDIMAHAGGQGVPGIALSGFGAEADIRQSIDSGFQAHLVKPVSVEALRKTIAEVLRAARV